MSEFSNYVKKEIRTLVMSSRRKSSSCGFYNSKSKKYASQTPNIKIKTQSIFRSFYPQQRKTQNSYRTLQKYRTKKNLFYQNMILQENLINIQKKPYKQKINVPLAQNQNLEIQLLSKKLEQVKRTRIQRQKYLYQISNKAQKLQKIVQSQEKYLKSKQLQNQHLRTSQKTINIIKNIHEDKKNINQNRRKPVITMMTKQRNFIN